MSFRITLLPRLTRLQRLRNLFPRAKENLQRRLEQNVKPGLEADVQAMMSYPPPAVYPFQFATDLSRRYYFWAYKGQIPYMRTENLLHSWIVEVNAVLQGSGAALSVAVSNTNPVSIYVYEPRQVPGHRNTGWLFNRPALFDSAHARIAAEWGPSVRDALEND